MKLATLYFKYCDLQIVYIIKNINFKNNKCYGQLLFFVENKKAV